MPPLTFDDYKVIYRPQEGLELAKWNNTAIVHTIGRASGFAQQDFSEKVRWHREIRRYERPLYTSARFVLNCSEPTQHAYTWLQQVKAILANKRAHLTAPCDSKTRQGCEVLNHRNVLNDVMDAIKVHIKELVSARELALSFLGKTYIEPKPEERIKRALALLHCLFVKHKCVAKIVLDNPVLFRNPGRVALL
ncbi:hypothetical protein HPB50_011961 [Hyalomma asiaticum]|uniref:Uncharacterized protein n=1 Tax=Hyalomma asiaticum TaxID=266040 RepID=A0ACB7SQB0_HYAAI|nr:hypothetical protein HPB50_011961 [Hyalomma asiaticum]